MNEIVQLLVCLLALPFCISKVASGVLRVKLKNVLDILHLYVTLCDKHKTN